MKTYNKFIIGLISISTLAVGCKDKMVEMNTNPNTMQDADVAQLFTGATFNFGYLNRETLITKYSGVMALMQYITAYTAEPGNPYVDLATPGSKTPGSWGQQYNQFFNSYCGQRLYNLVKYIDTKPDKEIYQDVRAICEVLSVYQQWQILSNYGAMTYSEAFKGITDGITQPKYQTIQEVWQDLDVRLKAAVTILANPMVEKTQQIGKADFFNGWINTPMPGGGSTAAEQGSYIKQRTNWLKFANAFRFEMAWMLAKVEPANFTKVAAEVAAVPDGLMTDISDGTYFNYPNNYDATPHDVNAISVSYGLGESFINTLKRLDDPRLPYLARPNGLCPELSPNFMCMQQYFPDSLAKYGDLMTGKNIYVGKNTSPQWTQSIIWNANDFPNFISKTFSKLQNPKYPDALTVKYNGNDIEICPKDQKEFNIDLQIVSSSQARYYVRTAGRNNENGPQVISDNVNKYRFDGKSEVTDSKWLLRRSIYTYAQQCFLFAVSGTTIAGNSPAQWYAKGVEAAMAELKEDALRYGIQVAVNPDYPKIQGTRLATIPYTYDATTEASAMVAKSPYTPENAMAQAWVYFYNQPEVAYMWWLRAGLIPVKVHTNVADARADQSPYLEKPYKNDQKEEMGFPRRGCLPDRGTVNSNYSVIKSTLEAQPNFGQWVNTTGRIWWDVQ